MPIGRPFVQLQSVLRFANILLPSCYLFSSVRWSRPNADPGAPKYGAFRAALFDCLLRPPTAHDAAFATLQRDATERLSDGWPG